MKKTFLIISSIALLAAGCRKNLLNTNPYSSIGNSTMWSTDNFTDLGVAGVYQALRLGIGDGPNNQEWYQFDRLGSTGQYRDGDAFTQGTVTTGNGIVSTIWQYMYEGIWRANDAIYNITSKSPSDTAKKARYIAECKFLRAYFYFRLNQLWKGIPVYLEPAPLAEINRGRETEQKVWEVIVQDLTDAINEPNLPLKYAAGNNNYGHVTKGAAYALRGKAYLYQKKWAEAAADFQKVKDAGYGLFTTGSDAYFQLFRKTNEQSAEMIFAIQHADGKDANGGSLGSTTQKFCGTRSAFGSNWNNYLISPNLVDLYENADGSKFNWDDVIPGYNSMAPAKREVFFLRDNLTTAEYNAAAARGLNMSLYLPVGNEARIAKAYQNRDPRLAFNVITPYSAYKGSLSNVDVMATSRWPFRDWATATGPHDLQTDTRDKFYYLYRKFVYEGSSELTDRMQGPTDFPLIRYADVLLMWAEALNEQSDVAGAVTKVNEVRARAGVALLNSSPVTMVTGQADMQERIRDERRREFPNEGINYFDELRWRTLKDKAFYPGAGTKQVWGANVLNYTWEGDQLYTWPIPVSERQKNPSLAQNEGWTD